MVATDGSDTSLRAAKLGVDLARSFGGQVDAVYVVDVHRLAHLPGYAAVPGTKDRLLEMMLHEGREATEELEKIAQMAGVSCTKAVLKGHPADELLRYARESSADLLVIGSTGRGGLNRFLLGSVAEKVVQHSRIPVMLVPGAPWVN